MKQLLFLLLFCSCFSFPINAQPVYQLKPKKEIAIIGTGLVLGGAAYFLNKELNPLTLSEIESLQTKGISDWEEWTTGQGSRKSRIASDIVVYSTQLLPGIMTLADNSMRKDALKIGTLYSEVFFVNLGMTAFTKNVVRRARPFVYDNDTPLEEKMTKSARTSFYSGHTSETAAMCFLTASLYADYHPDSKWKPVVWTAAAVMPAAAGILRMRAGKHFPSDVITGYVMGAAVGYFLPKIHRPRKRSDETTFIKHF